MQKWINMVENFCTDPSREDEFNDFYNNVHLPDILKTPGFLAARRYVTEKPRNGRGKYLAIYDIETDDIDKTMATRRQRREQEKEQGRSAAMAVPGLILSAWSDVLFKQIYEATSGGPFKMGNWINMVELLLANPSREKALHDAYNNIHLVDILKSPGYLGARRYVIKEPRNGRGTFLAIYEIETDDMEKTMTTRLQLRQQERNQGRGLAEMAPNSFLHFWGDVQFEKIYELSNK